MGIVHKVVESDRFSGDFDVEKGVERFVIQILHADYLTVAPFQPLIFIERQHDDARRAVPLNPHRMQHRFIGVEPEFARDLLGGDLQKVRVTHVTGPK